jgi:hypothetical protein
MRDLAAGQARSTDEFFTVSARGDTEIWTDLELGGA